MEQHIHYVCSGTCGGVSKTPGICETIQCERYGDVLESCMCDDGNHGIATPQGENYNEYEDV